MHDPITYKVFSPHIHIVFLKNTVSHVRTAARLTLAKLRLSSSCSMWQN
jgi:hypothetical protein